MKKFFTLSIIVTFIATFIFFTIIFDVFNSVSKEEYDSIVHRKEDYQSQAESLLAENESLLAENESLSNKRQEEESKISDLFKFVYLPYAKREKSFDYDAVKNFAESCKSIYNVEIHDPTADDGGSIKLTDDKNNYVYFAFSPVFGVNLIMMVNYYQDSTNSEVTLSNYSFDGSPQYDQFTTHIIGENQIHVDSSEEQQNFLFN